MAESFDALLFVSFGGPEGPDEVIPFLENVLRGKNVPRERMLEVAEHYQHFGGVSPINAQNRALIAAVEAELSRRGSKLPVYFGNRNWRPMLADTLRQMRDDGVRNALGFFTSAFSSYSGCRQYRENIAVAHAEVGEGAPQVHKLRAFYNHPGYIETMILQTRAAIERLPAEARGDAALLFSAHSIPLSMATNCDYEKQLHEACRLIANGVGAPSYRLVYQSRSGPPTQPWLEPDVLDVLGEISAAGATKQVVLVPVGFISDHMEVLFDLDHEAKHRAEQLGLHLERAATAGTHPRFVEMICELVAERLSGSPERPVVGNLPPQPDVCVVDCCKYEPRRPGPPAK